MKLEDELDIDLKELNNPAFARFYLKIARNLLDEKVKSNRMTDLEAVATAKRIHRMVVEELRKDRESLT